jgi:glycosyltransferase involved in cell wall biosynthesis
MSAPRVIVSVTNDLYTDQRVHKVCSYLHDNGYNVLLVGRRLPNSKRIDDRQYSTHRMKLIFKKGALFYAFFNLRLFLFLLFKRCDILLSNDLDTLLANRIASQIKRNKLVYDSHELFTEVPELTARPKVKKVWLFIEKRIFPKLKHVYTVNDSIAKIYEERYGINVGVIRNVSRKWEPKTLKTKVELSIPEDKRMIILQGSGINIDRGGEEAVESMQWVSNAVLYIVGGGDVIEHLKELVTTNDLLKKVVFIDRVPYEDMMNYTYHADLGLTLDKDTNPNYRFSLPNKVFDYIHTGTPVLSSDLVEIRKVIEQHNVGVILKEYSSKSVASEINKLFEEPEALKQMKDNCISASKEECWENEREKLSQYFPSVH